MPLAIEETKQGLVIKVRAAPGASRNKVMGLYGESLKIAVTAAPENGKANHRLLQVLAKALALPNHQVLLLAGDKARDKKVCIQGLSSEELRQRLAL